MGIRRRLESYDGEMADRPEPGGFESPERPAVAATCRANFRRAGNALLSHSLWGFALLDTCATGSVSR
jgi:hypothetical protein